MGVLVCPFSRKHFLRVVSEWISDFGTISLGFLILSPNSHLMFKVKSHFHYSFDGLTSAGPRWQDFVFKLYSFWLFKSQYKNFHKDKRMLKEGCMLYNVSPSFSVYRYLCLPLENSFLFIFRKRNWKNGGCLFHSKKDMYIKVLLCKIWHVIWLFYCCHIKLDLQMRI